jgi:hypothetical protein
MKENKNLLFELNLNSKQYNNLLKIISKNLIDEGINNRELINKLWEELFIPLEIILNENINTISKEILKK